jgi:hypothetical protein
MLALLIEPAGAAPLYWSCAGTHQFKLRNGTPISASTTVSITMDLDKRTFGWTADVATTGTHHSCSEPTEKEKLFREGRGEHPGVNGMSISCSDAQANDLEYSFSIKDEHENRDCPEDLKQTCHTSGGSATNTSGKINRPTGELTATRSMVQYCFPPFDEISRSNGCGKSGEQEEKELSHDEWHMTCSRMQRRS